MKSPITTHVLDTSLGKPADGISVQLWCNREGQEKMVGSGTTDPDGRIMLGLIDQADFVAGVYRLRFDTSEYFERQQQETFYPEVNLSFVVKLDQTHYHVPLLISPFGYTTYRGS